MSGDDEKKAFRHDAAARSFRIAGFRRKDLPVLLVSLLLVLCLLTGFNVVADSVLAAFTPETRTLVLGILLGLCLGYLAGIRIGGRRENMDPGPPPSDRVKEIALDSGG
jgi:hypothetical protein